MFVSWWLLSLGSVYSMGVLGTHGTILEGREVS